MAGTDNIAALILAGGRIKDGERDAWSGVANRALVPLGPGGRVMLDYVVDAVRAGLAGRGRILVAATDDVSTPPGCARVGGGASMVDTLLAGANALTASETRLLVVTADVPFLSADAVDDFLRRSLAAPAELHYPIVPAALCAARFPEMRRTTLRIAEGTFTGGNLALLDPVFLRDSEAVIREAFARRKSVVGLARLLGPSLPLRLLGSRVVPGLLAVRHLEAAVGRALGGARARAVVCEFPEVGADVDRPDDVAAARRLLASADAAASVDAPSPTRV